MTAVSWFDGDIPQLQTMLFEAREALDLSLSIIRNKHAASATGTQQPCDLSPVFRLLKCLQAKTTASEDHISTKLVETIRELFQHTLRLGGLNFDGNARRKKSLMDFLCCLPEMAEQTMTKKNLQATFVEAGIGFLRHARNMFRWQNILGYQNRLSCMLGINFCILRKPSSTPRLAKSRMLTCMLLEFPAVSAIHCACNSTIVNLILNNTGPAIRY
jgi:hypothetical protein